MAERERIVSYLTEELVRLGHEVTLFASGDSVTSANLVPCVPMALRLDANVRDPIPYYMLMLDRVREQADEFDILHFHIDQFHFPLFRPIADRTVTTLHGRQDLHDLKPLYVGFSDMPLVSISHAQRKPVAERQLRRHRPSRHSHAPAQAHYQPRGGYLAFLGRISPEKRPDRAIAIARALGIPLKIAAKVDKVDEAYFRETIAPLLDQPGVEFIGEINERAKSEFLGEARALLFPIDWPEPFGLSMIEAMACGTPVLAFRCGSVPEIVDRRRHRPDRRHGGRGGESAAAACWRSIGARSGSGSRSAFPPPAWPRTTFSVYRSLLKRASLSEREAATAADRCSRSSEQGNELTGIHGDRGRRAPEIVCSTSIPEAPFYIPATGPATRPRRTLKHDDTFVVLDSHGDIGASAGGPDGLFHCDTRFLSHLELLLNGMQPLLLGSNVRDDNTLLTVDLTNPDIYFDDRLVLPKDTLHVVRTIFLWRDTAYQRLAIRNHGDRPVDLRLTMLFDSDFADLFEVRGLRRERRGAVSRHAVRPATAVLSYDGPRQQPRTDAVELRPAAERAHRDHGVVSPRASRPSRRSRSSSPSAAACRSRRSPSRSCAACAPSTATGAPPSATPPRSRPRTTSSTRCCAARCPTSTC